MAYCFLFKMIIIGDSGVGKSCLLLQFTDKRYREKHQVTIGVQFGAKMIRHNNNNIKLQIWDTAGQQSFKSITRGYYKNAIGAVLCYDVTNRESFNHITRWLQQAKTYGHEALYFVLVGNKCDQQKQRKISFQEGLRLAKQNKMNFLQTSAKIGTNVDEIFNILNNKILQKIQQQMIDVNNHPGIKIGNEKYENLKIKEVKQEINATKLSGNANKDSKQKSKCCK